MGGQKNPLVNIFQAKQVRRTEVPEHYEVVLAVKGIVKAHRPTCAIRGIVWGRAKTEPQNDRGSENHEADQNKPGQTAIELGVFVAHTLKSGPGSESSVR